MSGTTWDGRAAIRLSVSNWRTTEDGHRPHGRRLRSRARRGLTCRDERRAARTPPRIRARPLGARDPPAGCATARVRRRLPGIRRVRLACARATRGPDAADPAHRELRLGVERRRFGDRSARRARQLRRRALCQFHVRRRRRPCDVYAGEPHAARGLHVPRAADARAREPQVVALEDVLPRGRRTPRRAARRRSECWDRALRAARCDPPRRASQDARAPSRRRGLGMGASSSERTAGRRSGGSATGSAREPPASRRAVPRADRPPAEDGRPDHALRPRGLTARTRRRRARRSRVRVRLLRPGAPEPGLPRVRGTFARGVRAPASSA